MIKTVDLQFKDLLNGSNTLDVLKWFGFSDLEIATLDNSEIESAEKGLQIEVDYDHCAEEGSSHVVEYFDETFPESCVEALDDIAFSNDYWM